jgi:hypothetical protein
MQDAQRHVLRFIYDNAIRSARSAYARLSACCPRRLPRVAPRRRRRTCNISPMQNPPSHPIAGTSISQMQSRSR